MIRNITPLFFFAAALASAQPTIPNGNNLPQPGFTAARSEGNTNLEEGPAGADITWDFSTMNLNNNAQPYIVLEPSTSEFATTWPSANYVATYSDAGSDRTFYYNVLSDRMEVIADGISNLGDNYIYTTNPRTTLKFPFAYQETVTDQFTDPFGTWNTTLTYDGYGTLITPTNTFEDVVRIEVLAPNGNPSYQWWTLDPLLPVFTYSFGYCTQWAPTGTGINDGAAAPTVNVLPNPFTEQTTIRIDATTVANNAHLTLTDALGHVVYTTNLTSTTTHVPRGTLASGLYLYHVRSTGAPMATGRIVLN